MHISLIGSSGKLGKLIVSLLNENNISFCEFSRENLEHDELFLKKMGSFTEKTVFLDVSLPAGTLSLSRKLLKFGNELGDKIVGVVIGSTGHNQLELEHISQISKIYPVCFVSNFSKGIFLFTELLNATTSSGLKVVDLASKLGFDLAIDETHHVQKMDSPSGTALTLAEAASVPVHRIASQRVGKVVGEHTIHFSAHFESLKITHTAHSRNLFAHGALDLCKNIFERRPKAGLINKADYFALT